MTEFIYGKESFDIKGCALEVHKELGCGFLEEVYQEAMERELTLSNIPFEPQKIINIFYKGQKMDKYYKPDIICYDKIIVELKAVQALDDTHRAQVFNYLKATNMRLGLLINFGEKSLRVERILNRNYKESSHK